MRRRANDGSEFTHGDAFASTSIHEKTKFSRETIPVTDKWDMSSFLA